MPACSALRTTFFSTSAQYWGLSFHNTTSQPLYWQVRIRNANFAIRDLSNGNLDHQQRLEADGTWTHVFSGTKPLARWSSARMILPEGVEVPGRATENSPEYFCVTL